MWDRSGAKRSITRSLDQNRSPSEERQSWTLMKEGSTSNPSLQLRAQGSQCENPHLHSDGLDVDGAAEC